VIPGGRRGREIGIVFGQASFLGFFGGLVDCFCFSDEVVCFFGGCFAGFSEVIEDIFDGIAQTLILLEKVQGEGVLLRLWTRLTCRVRVVFRLLWECRVVVLYRRG